ncbi:MAG: VOC family protein [Planctomycetaceae bacterium]|nr:VOC family protein [Planctomycetaceae bacterium]MCP4477198.1 VOC family protein [Planctomycetaceae bacterium]MCP4778477.1 VOC family protein [Planctomycetaceae bacterium]
MKIEQIHHVAYRCRDAKETVDFYTKHLQMKFLLAISEDRVPSTKEPNPYMHLFLDAGKGNILAFFELPNSPEMGRDENTPKWVQHIAFQLENEEALLQAKSELEAGGIEVLGPTDHGIIKSIYLFDPNGHRLELTTVTATEDQLRKLDEVKWEMLDEWTHTKATSKKANWLHESEFNSNPTD